MYEWANEMNCAVTVCDTKGVILYMNEKACRTFAKHGDLIGKNLFDCHNPQSQAKIRELLETGGVNAYTIEKNGDGTSTLTIVDAEKFWNASAFLIIEL